MVKQLIKRLRMTDSYINDSSDNESKNSCAKSKLEMTEALLADLNLLNSATVNNGGVGGNSGNGGLNGNSTQNSGGGLNSGGNANQNLVLVLLKEISKLHETNKKICRNLHETKVEMEALKHAPHWGLSHRRDSISGLSTNSQPVGMRYNSFGLQSPAPTYHSQGNYTPGIVSDVIREIREVSRVREEALMDRMKTMVEERSWALNETNFRLMKESEEIKKSIHTVRSDMNQIVDRMLKLENEIINLKGQLSNQHQLQAFALREREAYGAGPAGVAPAAANKLRRNSLHLNYGRINTTDEFYGNNFNEAGAANEARYSNGSNVRKFGENNFGSSLNGGGFGEEMHEDSPNDQVLLLEKDALKLRRELQDALASKQESEIRITALENIVSTLKEQVPPAALMSAQHHGSAHLHPQLTNPIGLGASGAGQQIPTGGGGGSSSGNSSGNSSSNNSNSGGPIQPMQKLSSHHSSSNSSSNPYYYRTSSSNIGTSTELSHPPSAISPKLQKAAQIQSLASPSKQYVHLSTSAINVSGPVTDL